MELPDVPATEAAELSAVPTTDTFCICRWTTSNFSNPY